MALEIVKYICGTVIVLSCIFALLVMVVGRNHDGKGK